MKRSLYPIVFLTAFILFTQCKKADNVEYTTISGRITNSQTGSGLTDATLNFCKPFSHGLKSTEVTTPEVVFKVVTDAKRKLFNITGCYRNIYANG